jgi:hypothetical protein
LALLRSMLPIIQRHQMLSLSKVLFMQDRATRRSTAVVSRVTTAGVLNGHGEAHANTKSHQGTIHIKGPFARGAENFMQARQGKTSKASRVISAAELHERRLLLRLVVCHEIMQL